MFEKMQFGIISRSTKKGIVDKKQAEMMQEMMEKLHALEGGRVLDIW